MNKYRFGRWLALKEYADFGLTLAPTRRPHNEPDGDLPLKTLNVEEVIKDLRRQTLGVKPWASDDYFGELSWGDGVGKVKVQFTPYGGNRAVVRRLCKDMHGENVWICKKVIEVRHLYDEKPAYLVESLVQALNEVDRQEIDSPSNSYENLENLVLSMASKLRVARNDLFFYEGIRRSEEGKDYSIHFGLHGHGVQSRGQKRVDEFLFHVYYDTGRGVIKVIGQGVTGSLGQHKWQLDESEWIEHYMPSQKPEEIIDSQVAMFRCY